MLTHKLRLLGQRLLYLLLIGALLATPATAQAGADPAAVNETLVGTAWFDLYLHLAQTTDGFTPPVAARAFGYAGITLYEAVVPGLPAYQSLVGQLNGLTTLPQPQPTQAYHWPTVANSALGYLTRELFYNTNSDNRAMIETLEGQLFNTFRIQQEAATFARSVQHGRALGEALYQWSMTDGGHQGQQRNFPGDYQRPRGAGLWQPTPPTFNATPLQPRWGDNRPFVLQSGMECAPEPPPAYSESADSPFYQQAKEVYDTVRTLTPEQKIIARYWADDPGRTPMPPGHSIAIATQVLKEQTASLALAAETYARLGMALTDSFIGCWKVKYTYNLLRPISYIQQTIDPMWNMPTISDPVATPPFPEYTSGHSVQAAAMAEVMSVLFGEAYPITDQSHSQRGFLPRTFGSFRELAQEAAISRLYGGIHYRSAIEEGMVQGECIGKQVMALQFKKAATTPPAPVAVHPTPKDLEKYLVYLGNGTLDLRDPAMQTGGEQCYKELFHYSDAELAAYKAEMYAFYQERFGLDPDQLAAEQRVMFNFFQMPASLGYRAHSISEEAVPAEGWEVRDCGWAVIVTDPNGLEMGGAFVGITAPPGSMIVFGDYSIETVRDGVVGEPIEIHYEASSPILTGPFGYFTYLCDLQSDEFGEGRAYGVGLNQMLPDGTIKFFGRNTLSFPGGPAPMDLYRELTQTQP